MRWRFLLEKYVTSTRHTWCCYTKSYSRRILFLFLTLLFLEFIGTAPTYWLDNRTKLQTKLISSPPTCWWLKWDSCWWLKWEKWLMPLKKKKNKHCQISLELCTCNVEVQEWQNVCPRRAQSRQACHCSSQGTADLTKRANKGWGGFCGDIHLNNMVLCSQPTTEKAWYILFAPISSSKAFCTSTYWAYFTAVIRKEEFRQLSCSSPCPKSMQDHALEAGEEYFWGIMDYELQNQLTQQINKENTEW